MKFEDLMKGKTTRMGRTITDSGYWSAYSKAWDINYSSTFTKLIQEAGRLCDSYASDLFIDFTALMNRIKDAGHDYTGEVCLFGLRDMGVDGNSFIQSRLENNPHYGQYDYRAIYRLEIIVEEHDYCVDYGVTAKDMRMELSRVY